MTEQEIRDKWEALHHTLTLVYYQPLGDYAEQPVPSAGEITALEDAMGETCTGLDEANYTRIHGALWGGFEQEMIANGYPVSEPGE